MKGDLLPMKDQEILERGAHDVGTFHDELIRIICRIDTDMRRMKEKVRELETRIEIEEQKK